ncbi:MAG TPA: phosphate ABC transporter substrate-binding protein [bacterium]|nr:phosphate ABC transporter substrate-binding protein [bacterium]HPP29944.1 phosphate ABC transporter substrate-binding protein [bacterium]
MFKKILMVMTGLTLALSASAQQEIIMAGSTTVLPVAQKTAEVLMSKHPDVKISVRGGGSGVGITALIEKNCDIANSSRPIKDKEIQTAAGKGVNPKANVIGLDGIAVILHPSNPVSGLTAQQIIGIYTGKINNWSEVGGSNLKIVVVSRDSASGTFEAFNELALKGGKVRPDALMQASNQAVATTVAQTPGAIGYVGMGYISDKVKVVAVDNAVPSKETVLSKKYKYARPLFMYTDGEPKGIVKEYLDFVISKEGQKLVEEVGFIGLK